MHKLSLLLIALVFSFSCQCQNSYSSIIFQNSQHQSHENGWDAPLINLYEKEQNMIEQGMIVLSTMATTNMALSSFNLIRGENNDDFDVTNVVWNGINLGIGVFGLVSNKKSFSKLNSDEDMISLLKKNRNIVLINAGVDIGYIGLGVWRRTKNKGQGDAIIYNGALLFAFDTIFGLIIHKRIKNRESKIGMKTTRNGIGLAFSF